MNPIDAPAAATLEAPMGPLDLQVEPKIRLAPQAMLAVSPIEAVAGEAWTLEGCATAFSLAAEEFGRIAQLTALRYGHEGLAADVSEAFAPGTPISLGFEAVGYTARRGEVVACEPSGERFRIGIRFECRLAA